MTKLVYPTNGVYNSCRSSVEATSRNLSRAVSYCSFSVPYTFNYTYRNYLYRLRNILNGYYKEINSIGYRVKYSDNNFETLENDLENSTKKMVSVKIKDRDRMIV